MLHLANCVHLSVQNTKCTLFHLLIRRRHSTRHLILDKGGT